MQEGTQHGEDCNGGARVDHERRDEHAADRAFSSPPIAELSLYVVILALLIVLF